MINLLPADNVKNLRAARANTLLLRYVILLIFVFAGMIAAFGVAYYILSNDKSNAETQIEANSQKEKQYTKVRTEAREFRSDLSSAKAILSKRVAYTKILLNLAKAMPKGTVMTDVTLDPTMAGKPIAMKAKAINPGLVIELRNQLQDSGMFSDIHYDVITIPETPLDQYRYEIDFKVTFKREALQ